VTIAYTLEQIMHLVARRQCSRERARAVIAIVPGEAAAL
jgi:hypothetical protein